MIDKKPYWSADIVPARQVRLVTPSNDADLPDGPCRYLFIGTGGDVEVVAEGDSASQVFKNLPDGSYLYVAAKRVRAASTSADDILANY